MNNLRIMIEETVESISTTTDCFYQQRDKEGYTRLEDTLSKLIDTIDQIYLNQELIDKVDINRLNANFNEAMIAMQSKDTILLSDILLYEVVEQLQEIKRFA